MDIARRQDRLASLVRIAPIIFPAIAAAALIPFQRPGLNVTIVGIAVVASLAAQRPRGSRSRLDLLIFALLIIVPFTMIDAEWVLALDMLGFGILLGLACVAPDSWAHLRQLPGRFLFALPKVPTWSVTPVREYIRTSTPRSARIFIGTSALTLILLAVFGGLFVSADKAFASFVRQALPSLELEGIMVRSLIFLVVFLGVAWLAAAQDEEDANQWEGPVSQFFGDTEWKAALGILVLLFLGFVSFQFTVLSGGADRVLATAGLTYAEFARQGFFQLIAAGSLVLLLLAAVTFKRPVIDHWLRGLLGTLCVLTLLILVFALKRLMLYEAAFGFTRARLTAHAVIYWLGALIVLLLASRIKAKVGNLPRMTIAMTAIALVSFNAINPDRLIARLNIDRFERIGKLDLDYLSNLSVDAFPEIERLSEKDQRAWTRHNRTKLTEQGSWMEANISRSSARRSYLDGSLFGPDGD